ncbi:MAG: hypothetical protein RR981_07430 [Oscillospiraceae bacterium]
MEAFSCEGKREWGYSDKTKASIKNEYKAAVGVRELSRKYGISRYAIQIRGGLRPEIELRHATPLSKDRPKEKQETQGQIIKCLKMENGPAREFLLAVGRK